MGKSQMFIDYFRQEFPLWNNRTFKENKKRG